MVNRNPDHKKGVTALILLAFLGSLMGVFARYLYAYFSLFQQIYLRFAIASVLGLFLFKNDLNYGKLKKITSKEWFILMIRSFTYAIAAAFWVTSVNTTKYANAMFIDAIPLSAVWGVILFREKLTSKKALYLVLAMFGIMVLAVKDYSNLLVWGKGEILMLIAVVLFSFRNVARKWHSKFLNNQEISQLTLLITGLMLFIMSLAFNEDIDSFKGLTWEAVIMMVLGGLTLMFIVFFTHYGFDKLEAIIASNISTLGSIFGVLIGFIVYKEVPTLKELFGGIIIIGSVIQMNRLNT